VCPLIQRVSSVRLVLHVASQLALVDWRASCTLGSQQQLNRRAPVQVLHAQQQQRQRFKALDRFKGDAAGVLVATDVAARGLDVPAVACVIQYQLPLTADTYIHRAGRTARGAAAGANVAFVVPAEAARFRGLHAALGRDAPPDFPIDFTVLPDAQARKPKSG
jgi:ATP-dependent RNA helicase DDX24/MAK5